MIELIKRLAPDHTNTQIAEQLDTAGLRTSTGLPFDDEGDQVAALALPDRPPSRCDGTS